MGRKVEATPGTAVVVPFSGGALPSLQHYLGPTRAIAATKIDWSEAIPEDPSWYRGRALTPSQRELLQRKLALVPSRETLRGLVEALYPFVEAEPDPDVTELAVALLFDSRARQPANGPAYVAALTHDLIDLGFPASAVVAGCEEIRRTKTFMPEIAEVIEVVERHTKNQRATLRLTDLVIDRRAEIVALLEEDDQRRAEEAAAASKGAGDA